ncbi:MAG: hypothetical protein V4642_10410 [Bacteroidota bacterium]
MKYILLLTLTLFSFKNSYAQGSAGSRATIESRTIVDMPTAGVIAKGKISAYTHAFENGGIMAEVSYGVFKNINIGASYSGTGIIGSGAMSFQGIPGAHIRARILDEAIYYPGILLGVQTQGRGAFLKALKSFQTPSPGAFIALSKAFTWKYGTLALHSGANYSFEGNSTNRKVSYYGGVEQSLLKNVAITLEYNALLQEGGDGLANAALRWSFAPGLTAELQLRNLLKRADEKIVRNIALEYVMSF